MNDQRIQNISRSEQTFKVDLNSIRDDNCAVALLGHFYPQLVPQPNDIAVAMDEDGACYDATVESVLGDGRVYLRVIWATKRIGKTLPPVSLRPQFFSHIFAGFPS
jgi:hypothetical protein